MGISLLRARREGEKTRVRERTGEILISFYMFFFKIHPASGKVLNRLEQVLRSGAVKPAYPRVFRVFSSMNRRMPRRVFEAKRFGLPAGKPADIEAEARPAIQAWTQKPAGS